MTERYPDPIDQGAEVAQDLVDGQVEAIRRSAAPEQEPDANGVYRVTECIEPDCGEELPIERIRLGKVRCVTCQSLIEHRSKQRYR